MIFKIIPRLDILENNLVKCINLQYLRLIGDPIKFSEKCYIDNADEIFLQYVVASLHKRNNLSSIVNNLTKNIFTLLSVGCGIKNIYDIKK